MTFVLGNIPTNIRGIMSIAGIEMHQIDYFIFHQANKFLNEHLIKKLKLPSEKVPESITDFGNTGGASIFLTIVTQLIDKISQGKHRLLLSGFGIGMTWGSAILTTEDCCIIPLIEISNFHFLQ